MRLKRKEVVYLSLSPERSIFNKYLRIQQYQYINKLLISDGKAMEKSKSLFSYTVGKTIVFIVEIISSNYDKCFLNTKLRMPNEKQGLEDQDFPLSRQLCDHTHCNVISSCIFQRCSVHNETKKWEWKILSLFSLIFPHLVAKYWKRENVQCFKKCL